METATASSREPRQTDSDLLGLLYRRRHRSGLLFLVARRYGLCDGDARRPGRDTPETPKKAVSVGARAGKSTIQLHGSWTTCNWPQSQRSARGPFQLLERQLPEGEIGRQPMRVPCDAGMYGKATHARPAHKWTPGASLYCSLVSGQNVVTPDLSALDLAARAIGTASSPTSSGSRSSATASSAHTGRWPAWARSSPSCSCSCRRG